MHVRVLFDVFAEKWLGSLFAGCMYEEGRTFEGAYPPVSAQLRFLDLFFCEGPHALFWVALTLFRQLEVTLGRSPLGGQDDLDSLKHTMAGVMATLDDPDDCVKTAAELGKHHAASADRIRTLRAACVAIEHTRMLREAVVAGHPARLGRLLAAEATGSVDLAAPLEEGGAPLLHEACRLVGSDGRHAAVVKVLLAGKASAVDAPGADGGTALHVSVRQTHSDHAHTAQLVELIDTLVAAKADLHARDVHGATPLHVAAASGNDILLSVIMSHSRGSVGSGQDCTQLATYSGRTPLMVATAAGHWTICDYLIKKHADVDAGGAGGESALMLAVAHGHLPIAELLLEHRADVNRMAGAHLSTALHAGMRTCLLECTVTSPLSVHSHLTSVCQVP